jgi:hypothetical protein
MQLQLGTWTNLWSTVPGLVDCRAWFSANQPGSTACI